MRGGVFLRGFLLLLLHTRHAGGGGLGARRGGVERVLPGIGDCGVKGAAVCEHPVRASKKRHVRWPASVENQEFASGEAQRAEHAGLRSGLAQRAEHEDRPGRWGWFRGEP